ncbi:MAG: putative capsid protein [Circoviridae sp.]|nr:MAG: putative capsid protein [Circoviridae sp.]
MSLKRTRTAESRISALLAKYATPAKKRRVPKKAKRARTITNYRIGRNVSGVGSGGFPSTKKVTLKYVENLYLSHTAAGMANDYFSANGLYDPYIAAGGHQPMGFDQWCNTIYNHYCVTGSRIRITYNPHLSTLTAPGVFGLNLVDENTAFSTIGYAIEQSSCAGWSTCGDPNQAGTDGTGKPLCSITAEFDAAKMFRMSDPAGASELQGSVSANPAEQAIFHVWMRGNVSSDAPTHHFLVEIEYDVVFSEPNQLAQS